MAAKSKEGLSSLLIPAAILAVVLGIIAVPLVRPITGDAVTNIVEHYKLVRVDKTEARALTEVGLAEQDIIGTGWNQTRIMVTGAGLVVVASVLASISKVWRGEKPQLIFYYVIQLALILGVYLSESVVDSVLRLVNLDAIAITGIKGSTVTAPTLEIGPALIMAIIAWRLIALTATESDKPRNLAPPARFFSIMAVVGLVLRTGGCLEKLIGIQPDWPKRVFPVSLTIQLLELEGAKVAGFSALLTILVLTALFFTLLGNKSLTGGITGFAVATACILLYEYIRAVYLLDPAFAAPIAGGISWALAKAVMPEGSFTERWVVPTVILWIVKLLFTGQP